MPSSAHGSLRGSLLETTLMSLPSTLIVSLSTIFTSALKVPSMESYLSKWDACNFINVKNVFHKKRSQSLLETYILDTTTVIKHNNFERRVLATMPTPEEVPTNPSEPVNRNLQFGHCLSSNRSGCCHSLIFHKLITYMHIHI